MSNNEIKIKVGKSSLSEFVKKPLPTEKEAEAFEKYCQTEAREAEIKDSLSEIYQGDDGKMVDVKKLDIKKRRGWFFWLTSAIFTLFLIGGAGFAIYNYLYPRLASPSTPVDLIIGGEKEIIAGKELSYTVEIKNNDKVAIKNIEVKINLPDGFVLTASDPAMSQPNGIYDFTELGAHRSATIQIKGRLIGEELSSALILADMVYTPVNFSSEFKKSASFETTITDTGLIISFQAASGALVGSANDLIIKYKAKEENYLNNFLLAIDPADNLEILRPDLTATSSRATTTKILLNNNSWLVDKIDGNERELAIKFKITKKKTDQQDLTLNFSNIISNASSTNNYAFKKKILTYDIIRSDLNLNLIVNGSTGDRGIDFGQTLNYSLVYANKGETTMKDVLLMAVLESDWLDWQTLADLSHGAVSGNSISWSKNEIPLLAELPTNAEGTIDWSIKVKPENQIGQNKIYQVKSYAQYSLGGKEIASDQDNRSNTILNKINSDLGLKIEARYFNDDNIAVGFGPLPPRVGQTTSFKIYLTVTNNLHELSDTVVTVALPNYVDWNDKNQTTVGNIFYDSQSRLVTWQIGRLPLTNFKTQAEFNLSLTPSESDRNKILVLLPGAVVSASDTVTNTKITKTSGAKTTKLEDDPIAIQAGNDGIVQ